MASSPTTTDFTALDRSLDGRVVLPGDPAWDAARSSFNHMVDQRPRAIANAATDEDVARVVRFAASNGLRVAPQGGGHNTGPLEWDRDAIMLRTEALRGFEIDPAGRRARVRAGERWRDVVRAAGEHGLAALHGSSPTVGVVGYSVGGGMGWYARKHGLQAHHLTAAEIVTADGRSLRVSEDEHADLFWALRGGGGNFGVVTALEFRLFDIPEVYAGIMFFPQERASEVLNAWRESLPGHPDEITSIGRLLNLPPLPDIPEPLRGRSFVIVEAAFLGPEEDGRALLEPVRSLGPEIDTFAVVGPEALSDMHMDPEDPMPALSSARSFGEFDERAIEHLLDVTGPGSESPLVSVEFRHTGGALAREFPGAAMGSVPGSLTMFSVGPTFTPDEATAVGDRLAALDAALAPYAAGYYPNLTEYAVDPAEIYSPAALERLRALKLKYDPADRFAANHQILASD